jgi:hypothetical protein
VDKIFHDFLIKIEWDNRVDRLIEFWTVIKEVFFDENEKARFLDQKLLSSIPPKNREKIT